MTQFPDFIPLVHDASEVILDMSFNELISVSGGLIKSGNFSRIVELDLSHNRISAVAVKDLPANLRRLYLDFNSIDVIKSDVLNGLPNLEKLRLANNSFKCSCDAHDLYEFLEVTFNTFFATRNCFDLLNLISLVNLSSS